MSEAADTNIAIACQGGGSHTAFTAGVLTELLPAIERRGDTLVGLSGTSGGAVSAVTGWYGLVADDASPSESLESVWADIAASDPADRWANASLVWGKTVENMGLPMPSVSPYVHPFSEWGKSQLRRTLDAHVDFDAIPDLASDHTPELVVGTVDISAGEFDTFTNGDVTAEAVLASATVPELFEAAEIDGNRYWDGLFSQNPPIRDLFHLPVERKPDELWVVQINPQTRDDEPNSLREIIDRRNELAGNLSLNQELHFIDRLNDLYDRGYLPEDEYKHTDIRRLQLDRTLDYASKLDREPSFITDLIELGRERATMFLADG